MKNDNFWKFGFIFLLIVVLGITGYFAFNYGKATNTTEEQGQTLSPTKMVSREDDEELIKKAVYKKFNSNSSKLTVTIQKLEGDYAKGGIKDNEAEAGGGYFLAARKGEVWVIVHDGQASPFCTQLEGYSFPLDMVSECLNSKGSPVKLN
jgi:hypothetical protein